MTEATQNSYRWSDLAEGMSDRFDVELTTRMMDSFRELSGDTNPLHRDRAFAHEGGFRDVVAFGLLTSAWYSRLVGVHLPGKFCVFHGIDVEFVNPAFVGDRLTVSGEIVHLTEALKRIELRGKIVTSAGTLISRARLRVGLHER